VNYKGIIEKNKIVESFSNNHVLFFPTENENFGHVIFESFAHGMPVITSNNTPWRNLNEIKVGFDLPLDDPKKFVEAIERFINMDNIEYKKWANNAINYAKQIANNKRIIESNINLFQSTLSSK